MTIESELHRIANALEAQLEIMKQGVQESADMLRNQAELVAVQKLSVEQNAEAIALRKIDMTPKKSQAN